MIIQNKLNNTIKFKIGRNKYIHLESMQECNFSMENSIKSLELINPSFANKKKTLTTIWLFPCLLIVYIVAFGIGAEMFEYSWYYNLTCINETDLLNVEYNDKKIIMLRCGNKIIETSGYSKIKSFIVFLYYLLTLYWHIFA